MARQSVKKDAHRKKEIADLRALKKELAANTTRYEQLHNALTSGLTSLSTSQVLDSTTKSAIATIHTDITMDLGPCIFPSCTTVIKHMSRSQLLAHFASHTWDGSFKCPLSANDGCNAQCGTRISSDDPASFKKHYRHIATNSALVPRSENSMHGIKRKLAELQTEAEELGNFAKRQKQKRGLDNGGAVGDIAYYLEISDSSDSSLLGSDETYQPVEKSPDKILRSLAATKSPKRTRSAGTLPISRSARISNESNGNSSSSTKVRRATIREESGGHLSPSEKSPIKKKAKEAAGRKVSALLPKFPAMATGVRDHGLQDDAITDFPPPSRDRVNGSRKSPRKPSNPPLPSPKKRARDEIAETKRSTKGVSSGVRSETGDVPGSVPSSSASASRTPRTVREATTPQRVSRITRAASRELSTSISVTHTELSRGVHLGEIERQASLSMKHDDDEDSNEQVAPSEAESSDASEYFAVIVEDGVVVKDARKKRRTSPSKR